MQSSIWCNSPESHSKGVLRYHCLAGRCMGSHQHRVPWQSKKEFRADKHIIGASQYRHYRELQPAW